MESFNDGFVNNLTIHERIALRVTNIVGTMGFVYFVFLSTLLWVILNFVVCFDPGLFNLFAIITVCDFVMMPLILVGQNLMNKFHEAKEEADFERNRNIEFHLLKMEAMINRLLPSSCRDIAKIEREISKIDDIIGRVPNDVHNILQQREEEKEKRPRILIKIEPGPTAVDYIVIHFGIEDEDEVLSLLRQIDLSSVVDTLPIAADFDSDVKRITFVCRNNDREEIINVLQTLFCDFDVILDN